MLVLILYNIEDYKKLMSLCSLLFLVIYLFIMSNSHLGQHIYKVSHETCLLWICWPTKQMRAWLGYVESL